MVDLCDVLGSVGIELVESVVWIMACVRRLCGTFYIYRHGRLGGGSGIVSWAREVELVRGTSRQVYVRVGWALAAESVRVGACLTLCIVLIGSDWGFFGWYT